MGIVLTEECGCGSTGKYYDMCDECDGTGERVTEEGKALIKFVRQYLFKDVEE